MSEQSIVLIAVSLGETFVAFWKSRGNCESKFN